MSNLAQAEYDRWAEYYDIVFQGLDGEAEFYLRRAADIGGPVLDLGCGTGRIAIPMAQAGLDVTALDLSEAMLEIARAKLKDLPSCRGRIHFVHADMRSFSVKRKFKLAVMPYRGFMHLLSPADQAKCLRRVFEHLERGGAFILNLWSARVSSMAASANLDDPKAYRHVNVYPLAGGAALHHYHAARYDEFAQTIEERHRLQHIDAAGRILREDLLPMTRTWITPREMEHLVRRAGFHVESVLGDFSGKTLDASSTEMVWMLRRAA